MKSVLIHCHPQMAYLARVLVDILQNNRTEQISFMSDSSFMGKLNEHFLDYLFKTNLLSHCCNINYVEMPITCNKIIIPNELKPILHESALDSLFRDLTPGHDVKSYYYSSETKRDEIQKQFIKASYDLTYKYVDVLRRVKPSHIYMSHSQYHHYIALYAASVICEVPLSVFHSGFFWTYRVHSQEFFSISPTIGISEYIESNFKDDVLDIMPKCGILEPRKAEHITVSSLCTHIKEYLETKSEDNKCNELRRPFYIICLPILKELATWYPIIKPLFQSRYDFIDYTLKNIVDDPQIPVIIKTHPMSYEYQEVEIIDKLLQTHNQDRVNKFVVLGSEDSCYPYLAQYQPMKSDLTVITPDGSISLELAQIGVKTICTSGSFGPHGSYLSPKSLTHYHRLISGRETYENQINPSLSRRSALYQTTYNKGVLKHNSKYGKFLKESFEPIYHFGNIRGRVTPKQFSNLLEQAAFTFPARNLSTSSQTHLLYP